MLTRPPADRVEDEQPVTDAPIRALRLMNTGRESFLKDYLEKNVRRLLGASEEIPADSNLMDLGFDSLMVMDLTGILKQGFELNLYPKEIYANPTLSGLAQYLRKELDGSPDASQADHVPPASPAPSYNGVVHRERIRNVAFVLSSPRAGSTLLRVMLAGHPSLFCPPELHLLSFESMQERRNKLGRSFLGEGLERAVMELKSLTADQSKTLVERWEEEDWSIQDVYRELHDLAEPRTLVDKSPIYSGSLVTLQRAEMLFEDAKYIHLIRHPYAVIESFVRNRMGKIIGLSDEDPHSVAEQVWFASNDHIRKFSGDIGSDRYHRIVYEDLVQVSETTMREACHFLGLSFHEAVLEPYNGGRMTDGVRTRSLAIGDPNFLHHTRIEPELSVNWKDIQLPRRLSAGTVQLASELGYELPQGGASVETEFRMNEDFVDARGLSLSVCSWGPADGPVVFCLHGILEQGASWELVAVDLARRGFRVIAPDQRGHGRSGHVQGGSGYNLMDFVADADILSRSFGNRPVILVGHSMGTAVASLLAAARPDRVRSLILVECLLPKEELDSDSPKILSTHLDYLVSKAEHPIFKTVDNLAERLRAATPSMSKSIALRMAERLAEPCNGGVRWRWDARLRNRSGISFDGLGSLNRTRYLELLRGISVPMTFVFGREGAYSADHHHRVLESITPNSTSVVLPGGHNLHMDCPKSLVEVIASRPAGEI
jgi:pimeloyl-ACP methyl ester carboxylesterase/aryl carrier-like protein